MATLIPKKRVLAEASSARQNIAAAAAAAFPSPSASPNAPPATSSSAATSSTAASAAASAAKKRRIAGPAPSQRSQQPPAKSAFESDVLEKLSQDIADRPQAGSEQDQLWDRPPVVGLDPARGSLSMQQIEAEEGTLHSSAATVKLFGVTDCGNSVLLHVTDFRHYFYVAAPVGFQPDDAAPFMKYLEAQVGTHVTAIHSVAVVMRENMYRFQGNIQSPYLRITVTEPKLINRVRTTVSTGRANWKNLWKFNKELLTFDNIQYVLRFMIDCQIQGMSWVEAPAAKYRLVPPNLRQSNCQIEAEVSYHDLVAHRPEGAWSKMAPLRILSFDIECAGRKGIFPEAEHDPVIQIANMVTRYGDPKPFVRNVFCLGRTNPIVATQVLEHEREDAMLRAWQQFLVRADPDIITGYNISNFDFPYLLKRARHLKVAGFDLWTRLPAVSSAARDANFSSKQMGNRDTKATNINGRLQLDLLQLIQRDHSLRSYTLNSVSATFLAEQKEDVHYSIITELFNGTAESRRRLALYCLKDAYLPQRLMDKLSCLENYTEMARVTGVPFNYLLARGQQIKFTSQLFRKALEQRLVIPDLKSDDSSEQYDGATVIEPMRGYYKVPIATLDFASLYPSIMQAHNLCYTTLVTKPAIDRFGLVRDQDYIVTPTGDTFVTASRRKGLLTQILEELLAARKQAKRELAVETDPFKKAVLNGRQLALKVSANSVYGLTGATNGKLPCLEIASSTTAFGRQMIERTKAEVEERYCIANGYAHDARVIYGDTDSVMIRFGTDSLTEAMRLGLDASAHVSAKFAHPIKLEFEKVYFPYLLINKKRYAGLYWTRPDRHDKMDTKGIETVRRDNCLLVQTVIDRVLRMILIDRDPDRAQDYVKGVIADLLQNRVDMSKLVITKALAKEDYAAKQPHVELAARMRRRDPGSAPGLGDRVAYVMVKGATGSKNFENSEDPIYVLENNVPIDTRYYLDNQLTKPLERIFGAVLGSDSKVRALLQGDHTRTISVAAPTVGGMMKFARKVQTCMGCKKPLRGGNGEGQGRSQASQGQGESAAGAVCTDCAPRVGELYNKTLDRASDLEVRFGRLWTQCQRCQGSMHCEVICSSKDCPIFYMRMKAKKDLEDANRELRRFDMDKAANW